PVAVEHAGLDAGDVAVEDLVAVLGKRDPVGLAAVVRIEQADLHLLGMRREEGEVRALVVERDAERIGPAFGNTVVAHEYSFGFPPRRGPRRAGHRLEGA